MRAWWLNCGLGCASWHSLESLVRVPTCLNVVRNVKLLDDHHHLFMRFGNRTLMEFSSKTTVPLTSSGWLLAGLMSIPLTFLS
ncbi:hypothetical protein TNCV_267011 [Trichonephila clavipes]|nr:hypothetical protein TNCV_267011 [Trichonephila clavipes]